MVALGSQRTGVEALARAVRRAFTEALASFSLRAMVEEALPPLPPKRAIVRVLAVGKAAVPMMRGALDRWPDRVDRGLVVTVDGASFEGLPARVETIAAAHPIPDERSTHAAQRALDLVRGLGTPDLVLALVSGGASALLALPPEGLTLDEKRALVRDLLESGATIREVNLVRRHVSRIKGGRLAAAAAPARVLTLAVSDVIGGGLEDIGSGPSVPDPTTVEEARAALRRFAPAWLDRTPLSESLKPTDAPRFRARVIAGPTRFAEHLAAHLAQHTRAPEQGKAPSTEVRALDPHPPPNLGSNTPSTEVRTLDPHACDSDKSDRPSTDARSLHPRVMPAEEGDAEAMAARRVVQARSLAPGEAWVIPCEPTLRVPASHGRGGRAGFVALGALPHLPEDVVLLCGATDGSDGSAGSAGAVVTASLRSACDPSEIERALATFDDAPLHARMGSRIETGPTGLNFADVHVLARR